MFQNLPGKIPRHLWPLKNRLAKSLSASRALVRDTVITLLAGGNALLEALPGLGKTMPGSHAAQAVDCSFSRIQFYARLDAG